MGTQQPTETVLALHVDQPTWGPVLTLEKTSVLSFNIRMLSLSSGEAEVDTFLEESPDARTWHETASLLGQHVVVGDALLLQAIVGPGYVRPRFELDVSDEGKVLLQTVTRPRLRQEEPLRVSTTNLFRP